MKYFFFLLIFINFNAWTQTQDGKPPGPSEDEEQKQAGWEQGKLEELEIVAVKVLNDQSKVCQGLNNQMPAPLNFNNFVEAYNTLFFAHNWYQLHNSPKLDVVNCKFCEGKIPKIPKRNPELANSLSPYLSCLIKSDNSLGITILIENPDFATYMKARHPELADGTVERMKTFFHLYLGNGHGQ